MALKPEQQLLAFELLKKLELFLGCLPDQLQTIAARLETKMVVKGKVAMMDQEINRTLYLLAAGSVSVWKRVKGEKQQLATLEAPNFFGERSMFEESPASALVKTETDCQLFTLDRGVFEEIAKQYPALKPLIHTNMVAVRQKRLTPVTPPHEGES